MPRYSPQFLDHFQHPRNAGVLERADGVGSVTSPACGDTTTVYLCVREGRVQEFRWQTRGCSGAIAASSAASELVRGLRLEEAEAVTREQVSRSLGGLPPAKAHGAVLVIDAVRAALAHYRHNASLCQDAS